MTRKKTRILIYCVLVLLAAALVTYGALSNSKNVPTQEEVRAARLAELKADLLKAAAAGSEPQQTSGSTKRTTTRKSPKAGST